jgi:tetratricopeptide (TPR) repeat protein
VQRAEQLGVVDPRAQLNVRLLQGTLELRSGVPADGLAILVDALDEAALIDPPLAARVLAVAGEAAFQAGDFDMFGKIGPLLDRLPEISDPGQQLLLRLLRAINPNTSGADPGRLRQDLAAAEQLEEPDVLIRVAGLAFGLGEYATARRLWSKAAAGARASGAAGTLAGALRALALDELSRGRYAWAESSAAEGRALALETGQPNLALQHATILAEVAGLRGRERDARQQADEILAEASRRGQYGTMALVRRALGQSMLAYGHPEEAIDHLEALWAFQGPFNRAIAIAVVPDLIEAAVAPAGRSSLENGLGGCPRSPRQARPRPGRSCCDPGRCSLRLTKRTTCSTRRCGRTRVPNGHSSRREPRSCTASTCAANGGASPRASHYAPPWTRSNTWAPCRGLSGRGASCARRASPHASGT